MKYVKMLAFSGFFALISMTAAAQTQGMVKKTAVQTAAQTEVFAVLGNCGMCERIIEKAAADAGASQASWDVATRQLSVTYDPAKTSADAIQKAVAQAGYDNAGYKAPDEVYAKLHGCCQYDRTGAPSTAKSCSAEPPAAGEAASGQATPAPQAGRQEVSATFKVLGDCGMCEKTIERVAKEAGATDASWDMDTYVMVVKFPQGATSVEKIQQAIADSGYDTPTARATDKAYKALPVCCQYDRSKSLEN
jgi:outer membrane receptor for ferrienterochelin and colicins